MATMSATDEPALVRRLRATEATEAQFTGKAWRLGRFDCWQLAYAHLRRLGWSLPKLPRYRTEAEAQAAMAAFGVKNLLEALDAIGLKRRPGAASALIGDILFMPGNGPLGTLTIALGNGAMRGFHEDHVGLVAMRGPTIIAAWDALP